jgi:DNA-directed RNA polymerase specialized sigma24 family protein
VSDLTDRLNEIHERLIHGSRAASKELFLVALKPIIGYLHRTVRSLTDDGAHDCAIEAIARHLEHPDDFDRQKSSLWTFLCLIAERDARDAVNKREHREKLLERGGYDIELWGVGSNNEYVQAEHKIDAERIKKLHGDTIVQTDAERGVLDLMLAGERSVAAYADALGLDLELSDLADQVKRVKDRINLRLKKVRDEL